MARPRIYVLIALCVAGTGCSETRVTRDPAGKLRSGFRYYDPRPIAIVKRLTGTREIVGVEVKVVPDVRKPRYVAQEAGLGVSGFELSVVDGMLTSLKTSQTQAPEAVVDKVTTQYKALVQALLDREKAAVARDEAAEAKRKADEEKAKADAAAVAAAASAATRGADGVGFVDTFSLIPGAVRVHRAAPLSSALSQELAEANSELAGDDVTKSIQQERIAGQSDLTYADGAEILDRIQTLLADYRKFVEGCPKGSPAAAEDPCPSKARGLREGIEAAVLLLPTIQLFMPSTHKNKAKREAEDARNAKLAAFAEKAEALLNKLSPLIAKVEQRWQKTDPCPVKPPVGPVCKVTPEAEVLGKPEEWTVYDIVVEGGVARLVPIPAGDAFLRDLASIYLK